MLQNAKTRQLLPLTFVILVLLAFTPVRWVSWLSSFSQLMQTLVAPVSHPLAGLSRWLSPADRGPPDPEAVRALEDTIEETKVQLYQALSENDRLRAMVKELQRGMALDPDLRVLQITVPVIGSAGDMADPMLTVRAGRKQGVDRNTIATAHGLQLVGRVVDAGDRTATVAPITSKSSGGLSAVILLDESSASGLACTLLARGDGTLHGDVEDRYDTATNQPIEPKVGAEVRLRDPNHWPRSAQMLLVGRVESVEPSPKQPLRKVVTVRPTIPNLERVSEVYLRIVPESDAPAPAGTHAGAKR
ncbi:MAG TPA: rod shape-determining protein MreC [Phycisphaerales bacterium]|nr:rod shape-determining protein MreC [Phycisphaerales bacterium]